LLIESDRQTRAVPVGSDAKTRRRPRGFAPAHSTGLPRFRRGQDARMEFVLWLIAVILVIAGIVSLLRGAVLAGIVLIIVGLLVGPGGVSVFT
jgi:hypothetical protein